ncbi:MAG: hypothetical protein HY888_11085 [Deltaproteobacteria bacterium]|nr:hypothetical protein [Deltaproteobacteria bacterium]
MNSTLAPSAPESATSAPQPDAALIEALNRLLLPLARLCLANGVTFATAEEIFKQAFVSEADALQPGAPNHGAVSRISIATGLNRREVTRLTQSKTVSRTTKPPVASEVFARWTTNSALRDQNGVPCALKRQGPSPSFEALSQSITRDVHPRSVLDELVRLGLVRHDEESDSVTLLRSDFIPSSDSRQMLGFLGDNVGDHLGAAVENVICDGHQHFEQAVFGDELSAESVETLRPLVTAHWQALRNAMVPAITDLIEADRSAGRVADQRVRIGLYTFAEAATKAEQAKISSGRNKIKIQTKGR